MIHGLCIYFRLVKPANQFHIFRNPIKVKSNKEEGRGVKKKKKKDWISDLLKFEQIISFLRYTSFYGWFRWLRVTGSGSWFVARDWGFFWIVFKFLVLVQASIWRTCEVQRSLRTKLTAPSGTLPSNCFNIQYMCNQSYHSPKHRDIALPRPKFSHRSQYLPQIPYLIHYSTHDSQPTILQCPSAW